MILIADNRIHILHTYTQLNIRPRYSCPFMVFINLVFENQQGQHDDPVWTTQRRNLRCSLAISYQEKRPACLLDHACSH